MPQAAKSGRVVATYLLMAGLQRGILLLILPFISRVMPPAEYGAATMLTAASLLLVAVIAAPLETLIFRTVAQGDDASPLLRVTGVYCYFLLPMFAAVIALAVALLVPSFLGVAGLVWGLEIFAVGLQPAMSVFALSVLQARQDLRKFIWIAATSIVFIAVTKFALVVIWQLGVLGWVISDLTSAGLSAVIAGSLVRMPRARVTADHIREVARFSGPLVPHKASFWAVNSLSRPALAVVSTLTQVGLLSFGLNLASVATLILAEINRAVLPRYSRETFRAPTVETLAPVRWQLIAAFIVPALVGSGVASVGRWIFAESYWPSFALTGILLVAQAAYGIYVIPMNYLTQTAGLPKFTALASGGGAILIFVAILVVGREYGAIGVSYATVAGFVTMAIIALVLAHALKLDIAWNTWLKHWPEMLLCVGALSCSVAALALPVGSIGGVTLAGVGALASVVVLLVARYGKRA